jgi:hypothetical protein
MGFEKNRDATVAVDRRTGRPRRVTNTADAIAEDQLALEDVYVECNGPYTHGAPDPGDPYGLIERRGK